MSEVLELAKKGDLQAIATLLNRSLNAKGIKVKPVRQDKTLKILLEGRQTPDQSSLSRYVTQGLQQIGIIDDRLELYGKCSSESSCAWIQVFQAGPSGFTAITPNAPDNAATGPEATAHQPSTPAEASDAATSGNTPTPQAISEQAIVEPDHNTENCDPEALTELAKAGNLGAIETFVKQVLSDWENLEIFVELNETTLKIIIQTKQFLDGPAFCGHLGEKLEAIASENITAVEFHKRKSDKGMAFMMKQATIWHGASPGTSQPEARPTQASNNTDPEAVSQARPIANAAAPSTASTPQPMGEQAAIESNRNTDSPNIEALTELAKTGNLGAIETFVKQALSDWENLEIFVELNETTLKIIIQTKQFLDGPAFCGHLGEKLEAIASENITAVEFHKRKSDKGMAFMMKQATIWHGSSPAASQPEPRSTEQPNQPAPEPAATQLRPNGQSSAMASGYREAAPQAEANSSEKPKVDPARVIAAIIILIAFSVGILWLLPRFMRRFGLFGWFALLFAIAPIVRFYKFWQPMINLVLTGK
ncbi:hypothetical protein IQ266_08170 [filamentous cyanobacterium LEGE 11480]|uniref:Uncharacterized protein n=1 Tax=Romeriopsis navalis LEGE 11480 TaxID=2777977 RepID=A0A928Z2M7_9CYAN|nr:hypothetical protein [Romeriopsis navalis]MBE9029704.1 hypothetical protein [Romeriopsis navalis LEGE 11480]